MTARVLDVSVEASALAVGTSAALASVTYRPLRHVVTVVHEAGHGVIALLSGRRLQAIRLNRDSSGETVSVGRSGGVGVMFTLLAGYPAPTVLGLAGIWAAVHAQGRIWVLAVAAALAVMLLLLRNFFGFLVLGGCLCVLVALARTHAAGAVAPAVMGVSAFLLVGGLRGVIELCRAPGRGDDARALARATRLGAPVWRGLFLLCSVSGFLLGAW